MAYIKCIDMVDRMGIGRKNKNHTTHYDYSICNIVEDCNIFDDRRVEDGKN